MKSKKKMVYEWFIVVDGSGEFPLDMLRYDSCFPHTENDSYAITHHTGKRRILLCRRGVNETHASEGRWKSLGWAVVYASTSLTEANDAALGMR